MTALKNREVEIPKKLAQKAPSESIRNIFEQAEFMLSNSSMKDSRNVMSKEYSSKPETQKDQPKTKEDLEIKELEALLQDNAKKS